MKTIQIPLKSPHLQSIEQAIANQTSLLITNGGAVLGIITPLLPAEGLFPQATVQQLSYRLLEAIATPPTLLLGGDRQIIGSFIPATDPNGSNLVNLVPFLNP